MSKSVKTQGKRQRLSAEIMKSLIQIPEIKKAVEVMTARRKPFASPHERQR